VTTPLGQLLRRRIAMGGPISLADFMVEALGHPTLGYYRKPAPIGAGGDFITAPEISQMFGELLGAWLADRWIAMGRPEPVRLVELGPGRGTAMVDALRATRGVPGFHAALRLHFVDLARERLPADNAARLAPHAPEWHERFDDIPAGPLLLLANEFFDALPVRQFQRTPAGWAERMVGLTPDGTALHLALAPGPSPFAVALPRGGNLGAIAEFSPAVTGLAQRIGARLADQGGWALILDYGHDGDRPGPSLQAVRAHRGASVLDRPGETDLSAHVDFGALARAARAAGARSFGPVGQGAFLCAIGMGERAAMLKRAASPAQASGIDAAFRRLIAPEAMGTLFRVLALAGAAGGSPPGFAAGAGAAA